jgi:hypothetical protein
MNPHLEFGQITRGYDKGRSIGIIDSRFFIDAVEAASIIAESEAWHKDDHADLRAWCCEYLIWLAESDLGIVEAERTNNHGSWFDAIFCTLAMFADQHSLADKVLKQVPSKESMPRFAPMAVCHASSNVREVLTTALSTFNR